jgi:hypothetical protein
MTNHDKESAEAAAAAADEDLHRRTRQAEWLRGDSNTPVKDIAALFKHHELEAEKENQRRNNLLPPTTSTVVVRR